MFIYELNQPIYNCFIRGSLNRWNGLPRSKSLFYTPEGHGLPIGNLTSQLFSNVYLSVFDDFVKRKLGCRYYGRYVDDFYIVHPDPNYLRWLVPHIRCFLSEELHLTLHPDKIVLQHYAKGVPFLGAYIKPHRNYPVKRTVNIFRAAIRKMEQECLQPGISFPRLMEMRSVINSYCGYLKHFAAYKILDGVFRDSSLKRYFYFTPDYGKVKIKDKYIHCTKCLENEQ